MPAFLNNWIKKCDAIRVLIILSFILWIYIFRGFVSGELSLTGDAVPYYDHFKFFLDNITEGVYPLWDAIHPQGIPNEFFLRRIGSFNPLYLLIIILQKCGVSFTKAYLMFLALYFWLGMLGFYCLAKEFFQHRLCAFIAYLLLMFSSLSTVLFDSFLMLSAVPIAWFFYFLLWFFRVPRRISFLGMTFTLMIIVITYLPFYFLHNILIFLACYLLYYLRDVKKNFTDLQKFVWKNKIFSLFCVVSLGLALIPGIDFFKEAARGDIMMSARHKDITTLNIFEVAPQTYVEGGILANNLFTEMFINLRNFIVGRFYIPFFVYFLFTLSVLVKTNKRIVMLSTWALIIFLIGLYEATPFYKFFYEHVFYVKYMRNFQYFLWLNTLPIFILLSVEHLRILLNQPEKNKEVSVVQVAWILVVGLLGVFYLMSIRENLWSSYVVVLGVSVFLILCVLNADWGNRARSMPILIFLLITIQPIEVYSYLTQNAQKYLPCYNYEDDSLQVSLPENILSIDTILDHLSEGDKNINEALFNEPLVCPDWFCLKTYAQFRQYLSLAAQRIYTQSPLLVYDNVERVEENILGFKRMNDSFIGQADTAFVPLDAPRHMLEMQNRGKQLTVEHITKNSSHVKVLSIDATKVILQTSYDVPKFLVYNDNYYRFWRVRVNSRPEELYRANLSFKGVWLPKGNNRVIFEFGNWKDYVWNKFLLIYFNIVLAVFMFLTFKHIRSTGKGNVHPY